MTKILSIIFILFAFVVKSQVIMANAVLTEPCANTLFTISTNSFPTEGGTTTGAGSYSFNQIATLTATPYEGYTFVNWTENEIEISDNEDIEITVTSNRNLVANFSQNSYTISTSSNPTNGGNTTGSGNYNHGATATFTAASNEGHTFINWTENGTVVSSNESFEITVTENHSYVANFSQNSYTISTSSNPTNGGTTTGGGNYIHGTTATLNVTPNNGYTFINWTENGTEVSYDESFEITVTENHSYVANFELEMSVSDWNPDKIEVYPNPFNDFIVLKAGNITIEKVEIYDLSGRLIFNKQINQSDEYRLETNNISKGNYVMKVYTNQGVKTSKIIKN